MEHVTKYVVELLEFSAFNILDISVASVFGTNTTTGLVVKVGNESTQIVPVVNYQAVKYSGGYVNVGSNLINEELSRILPNLSTSQVEDLKVSGIYEVLGSEDDSFYSFADLNEEMDVARLVAEDATEETETKSNKELEVNSFIDSESGEKVPIGKERFQGAGKLVSALAKEIYLSLSKLHDIEKRQECYDNLIFIGATFQIPGLKESILRKLHEEYVFREPSTNGNINSAILSYQQATEPSEDNSSIAQVPSSIKLSKMPEYFPEWKKPKEKGGSWHCVHFLGGEIFAKQIFGNNSNHGRALFVDSDVYEERGPEGVWVAAV